MLINYLSNSIVEGGKAPVFGTPADLGLAYDDVEFDASDGVTLRGWLIHGGTDKIIVQSHFGVQSSRSGYTPDGKGRPLMWAEPIPFLDHLKWLVDSGYSVLAYDFRNHGSSDAGTCPWVTWGPEEHKDVLAAVDFVTGHPTYGQADIGLLSICMGAASSTYAFGKPDGLAGNDTIKAMVAIQPLRYPDFMAALRLDNFVGRWVTRRNNERTGMDLVTVSFMPDVPSIDVPTLLVQNANDEYLNRTSIDEFYHALQVDKEMMWLDLGRKRAAGYDYLTKQPAEILSFFDRHM